MILGVVGAFVAVLFIGLLAVDVINQARGCGSVDPTDPANYTEAVVRNDTFEPVLLTDCRGTYCMAPGVDPIPSGATLGVRGACAASGQAMTSYRVTTLDGVEVGYIAIDTPRKQDGVTFDVSSASQDRQTPTSSQQ